MLRKNIIKIGAYTILIVGILFTIIIFLAGTILLISYPEANLAKKMTVVGGILIVCMIIILITLSLFESLLGILKINDEVCEIMSQEKESNYFTRTDV